MNNPNTCNHKWEFVRHGDPEDIGWRLLPEGVRVAYWVDSDGREGQVLVPMADICEHKRVAELRSHADLARDEFLPALAAWLNGRALSEEWAARTKALIQWRSGDRLAALVRWWGDNRIDGDGEIFEAARAWRLRYLHLANWWRSLQDQIALRLRERYRVFAAEAARRYSAVVIEDFDLREVARRPEPDSAEVLTASNAYRQAVSPSVFRAALLNACQREGVRIIRVAAADTTRRCHTCGAIEKWDQAADLLHRCGCGALWDQDANAARNLLASADGGATENQRVAQRKWDRVRDRSRKPDQTASDQTDAG